MPKLFALLACFSLSTGIALADPTPTPGPALAPSAVVAGAATYDQQDVTVSGTVKGVTTQDTRGGRKIVRYQLCDSQCVNVVQLEGAAPTEGQMQTISGHFRAKIDRGRMKADNVVLVGNFGGGRRGQHR